MKFASAGSRKFKERIVQKDSAKQSVQALVPFAGGKETLRLRQLFFDKNQFELRKGQTVGCSAEALWPAEQDRALARITHGWIFLRGVYTKSEELTSAQRLEVARVFSDLFYEWQLVKGEREMVFHDETVAQRVVNLCVFQDSFSKNLSEGLSSDIDEQLREDIQLLADPKFYAGNNNHGMFQDFGIILAVAYMKVPRADQEKLLNLAFRRLSNYMSSCFTIDGIHVENSPSYHLMVSRYLNRLLEIAQAYGRESEFKQLSHLLGRADAYAAAALSPLGNFVPISDTKSESVQISQAMDAYGEGKLVKAINELNSSTEIAGAAFAAPASGYFSAKSASHFSGLHLQNQVFFQAAYNADYHKHSDENNLLFYLDGKPALTESGPNGYQYDDPYTKYAYSSAAHNSLIVDGHGLPRIDRYKDKTRLYYHASDEGIEYVSGVTERYKGVKWKRGLRVSLEDKLERIQISDSIVSSGVHEYVFPWHFGSGFEPLISETSVLAMNREGGRSFVIQARTNQELVSKVYRGHSSSKIQGWRFPKMGTKEASSVVEFKSSARNLNVEWELKVLAQGVQAECIEGQLRLSGELKASVKTRLKPSSNGKYQLILVDSMQHANIYRDLQFLTEESQLSTVIVDSCGLSLTDADMSELEESLSRVLNQNSLTKLDRVLSFPVERRVFKRVVDLLNLAETTKVDICFASVEELGTTGESHLVYRLAVGRILNELGGLKKTPPISKDSFWAACSRLMRSTTKVVGPLSTSLDAHTVFIDAMSHSEDQRSFGILFFRNLHEALSLTVYKDGVPFRKADILDGEVNLHSWTVPAGSEYFVRIRSAETKVPTDFKSWNLKVR